MDEQKQKPQPKRTRPIVGHRTLIKMGDHSYGVTIAKEWFAAHGIDPDEVGKLLVITDSDIRIVNPANEQAVYDEVTRIVRNVR